MKRILLLLIFLWLGYHSMAQQRLACGGGKIDTSALNRILVYERTTARSAPASYLVKVFFTVFANDNGANPAASLGQIASEFTSLLASYSARNICFINMGVDTVNNTAMNNNFNADTDPDGNAFNPYKVPDCINIFYLKKINGNNPACNPPCGYGGIALGGIPGNFFLVASNNIGQKNTIGHEMGHSLGLLHTFEDEFGLENIDGSNSSTAGDRIEDTGADPFAYNGDPCFSSQYCIYTGTCTDPNGQNTFLVPYNNLMAYWSSSTCFTDPEASPKQFDRVETVLATAGFLYPSLASSIAPYFETLSPVTVSSGYYMRAGIFELSNSGNLILNGSVKATLGSGKVTLTNGFTASPTSIGAIVRITSKLCD